MDTVVGFQRACVSNFAFFFFCNFLANAAHAFRLCGWPCEAALILVARGTTRIWGVEGGNNSIVAAVAIYLHLLVRGDRLLLCSNKKGVVIASFLLPTQTWYLYVYLCLFVGLYRALSLTVEL